MKHPVYQALGNPSDPPLIFLHGLGAGSNQTISAFPALPNTYLVAPDMPGHGNNQPDVTTGFSFNTFADLTIKLIDHLGYESVNLGGLSMGSGIALNLAIRYPERIKKLILLRPSWSHIKRPKHLELVAKVGQWIEDNDANTARKLLNQCDDFQLLKKNNPPVAESIETLFLRPQTTASTAVLYKMWQDSPYASPNELQAIKHRTLILTTEKDELHPQSAADIISAELPHCLCDSLPARYHEPRAYQEALNQQVIRFLNLRKQA